MENQSAAKSDSRLGFHRPASRRLGENGGASAILTRTSGALITAFGTGGAGLRESADSVGRLKLPLETGGKVGSFENVSTVSEIEHAIERLPDTEVVRLAAWLAEHRRSRQPSTTAEHHDLDSLIGTWREDPAFDAAIRAFEQVDAEVWK